MKKSALGLFAVVLLSGCAESARETKVENDSLPVANATEASETPSAETAEPPEAVEAASPIDAAELLASTLERAKAENKRVMVHLGAPG